MNPEYNEAKRPRYITGEERETQKEYTEKVRKWAEEQRAEKGRDLYCYIETFGCQQNEADSERLAGMAREMGYTYTAEKEQADLILVNTCAVREHAEKRAFSITGQYKHLKEKNPELIIGICGCMVSQETRKERIRHSYPYVSLLFGTSMLYRFPEILYTYITRGKRQFFLDAGDPGNICEGLPIRRGDTKKAWVSIMYGCNNFCSYCIVPYVRGRERSRLPEHIIAEVEELVRSGYREITLLGQNVNSYGRDLPDGERLDFPELLSRLCEIEGDFKLHFMTSHPKDASKKLIDVMAEEPKVAHHFHLPLQSGSDGILVRMNRRYTLGGYLETLSYLRKRIPDVTVTSDIIIGFPGETEEDFSETLRALEIARYDQIFSFLYSPRTGTPAEVMPDQIPEETKQERMQRLLALQTVIMREKNEGCVGQVYSVLIEGESRTDPTMYAGRTEGGKLVHMAAASAAPYIGETVPIRITHAETYHLFGEVEV